MTPSARLAAAIDILDQIQSGLVAEKALSGWGRKNRYAGSKDRAAVRDILFSCLRQKRSVALFGGGDTGRSLVLGLMRKESSDLDLMFSGEKYAPEKLTENEAQYQPDLKNTDPATLLDCPDWAVPHLKDSIPDEFEFTMKAFQQRAPLYVRVNQQKSTVAQAQDLLFAEGMTSEPNDLAPWCLQILDNPRRLQQSRAYLDGHVEIQDAASQAVVHAMPVHDGLNVLDYCAGGGGKSLAICAKAAVNMTAHDVNPRRMQDIEQRAARAGVAIKTIADKSQLKAKSYDLVVVDAPCSGSGTWGRNPESKWALTPETLSEFSQHQQEILAEAAEFVTPKGDLFYVTCSLFALENTNQVTQFLATQPNWRRVSDRQFTPLNGGDGLFYCHLQRQN